MQYPAMIERFVREQVLRLHAIEEITMVQTLASCPTILHWIARTPAWAVFAEQQRT